MNDTYAQYSNDTEEKGKNQRSSMGDCMTKPG